MERFDEGLRCQDVYAGLRNVDQSSGVLVPLSETQRVGMAVGVASLIRGRDIIPDAESLKLIAAEQLDVNALVFNSVIETLEDSGMVSNVKRSGRRIESFTENVPYYSDLYTRLGDSWRAAQPTELEQQVVLLVDHLSHAPAAYDDLVDDLGLDSSELPEILEISEQSSLIKSIDVSGSRILYSPFLGFEHPQEIAGVIAEHGSAEIADAFATIRGEQGMPVSMAGPIIEDAVARGLLMAPSVELPEGKFEAFAMLPYSIDPNLLKNEKPILEKALAVIACLRTAQHFGGFSNLSPSALVRAINKLLDPDIGYLLPHSSHARQYRLLNRVGVIQLAPDLRPNRRWVTPTFIDTLDNRAALELARDLLTYGESLSGRSVAQNDTGSLLDSGDPYGTPMKTVDRLKSRPRISDKKWQLAIDQLMGHTSK